MHLLLVTVYCCRLLWTRLAPRGGRVCCDHYSVKTQRLLYPVQLAVPVGEAMQHERFVSLNGCQRLIKAVWCTVFLIRSGNSWLNVLPLNCSLRGVAAATCPSLLSYTLCTLGYLYSTFSAICIAIGTRSIDYSVFVMLRRT